MRPARCLPRLSRTLLAPSKSKVAAGRCACTRYSSTGAYNATIDHLRIDGNTRVIYQGISSALGSSQLTQLSQVSRAKRYASLPSLALAIKCSLTLPQATSNAKATIEYGTKIVGGVSPGKGGQTHLGLPVFDTVKQAMAQVKPDVSAVFVPAAFAAKAITEAIEAEVPLVVSVAEHVPIHDMLRVHQILKTSRTRLVGPNCPGIIAPEQCRVGIMPYKQYMRGCVGIVSKSGTLSYEAVGATTKAGLGQSIVVGMGGDLLPGMAVHL
jgi:predicted CoA-binding protein